MKALFAILIFIAATSAHANQLDCEFDVPATPTQKFSFDMGATGDAKTKVVGHYVFSVQSGDGNPGKFDGLAITVINSKTDAHTRVDGNGALAVSLNQGSEQASAFCEFSN